MWILRSDRSSVWWGFVGQNERCVEQVGMSTSLWSQQSNWEQTGDESGALLMGAFCLRRRGTDMAVEGKRSPPPPLGLFLSSLV